jgi:hypothetical protein
MSQQRVANQSIDMPSQHVANQSIDMSRQRVATGNQSTCLINHHASSTHCQ